MTQLYIPTRIELGLAGAESLLATKAPTFTQSLFFFVQNGQSGRTENVCLVNAADDKAAREIALSALGGDAPCLAIQPFTVAYHQDRLRARGFAKCLVPVSNGKGTMRIVDQFSSSDRKGSLCDFFLAEGRDRATKPLEIDDALTAKCATRADGKMMVYQWPQVRP